MNKMEYKAPIITVKLFEPQDIVTTSSGSGITTPLDPASDD